MKKRNIIAILAALAATLVLFAACGEKEPEVEEPSTIIGVDGQVYEEVTEIATEIVTEIVSEVVSEVVTDKEGKTEIKTEIVTEIKSEVVTSVVTVTIPYESATADKTTNSKQETTSTSASETPSEGSSAESTTTYEDVTFPEGTLIEVEMGTDGKPKETLMQKVLMNSKNNKQFYLNATIVTGETLGFETGVPIKMYMKGDNSAMEFSYGGLKIRMVYAGDKIHMIFPVANAYYTVDAGTDNSQTSSSLINIWDSINPDNMNYTSTSKVTIKGTTYTCEEYSDSTNVNKFYFNSKKELKRIEIITAEGDVTIFKISECSAKVDDSIFDVPKGYTKLTDESMQSLFSGLM